MCSPIRRSSDDLWPTIRFDYKSSSPIRQIIQHHPRAVGITPCFDDGAEACKDGFDRIILSRPNVLPVPIRDLEGRTCTRNVRVLLGKDAGADTSDISSAQNDPVARPVERSRDAEVRQTLIRYQLELGACTPPETEGPLHPNT